MQPTHSHRYGNRLENCHTPETCEVQAAAMAYRASKTVTLAQLTERFGLPADQQQGVYAWTNAHGDPSGDSALWTEEEAAELVTVWMDTNRDEYMADADTVDVEYHAEGGETVHEVPGWVTGK